MIQRIQTFFWILALVCLGIFSALPYATFVTPHGDFTLSVLNLSAEANGDVMQTTYPLVVLLAITSLLLVLTIFQYRKRTRQIHLSIYAAVLQAGVSGLALYYLMAIKHTLEDAAVVGSIVICLPLVAAVCTLLGMRFVRKDIAFLKRMDRLR